MSPLGALAWMAALIAAVLILDFLAVLLVRAEQRQRDRDDVARRAQRRADS